MTLRSYLNWRSAGVRHALSAEWPGAVVGAAFAATLLLWFARGNMILFIDGFYPFGTANSLVQLSGSWSDYNGIGTLNVSNLPLEPYVFLITVLSDVLLLPPNIAQGIVYVGVVLVASIFMYLFVRNNSFHDPSIAKIAATAAALLYGANPVFLVLYWYLNFPGCAGVFAAAPALAYFLHRGLKRAETGLFDFRSLLGIAIFSVVASTSVVPYVAATALIFVLLMVVFASPLLVDKSRAKASKARYLVASTVAVVLSNAYWLIPQSFSTGYIGGPNAYSTSGGLADLYYNSTSASPLSVATYWYFPTWNHFGSWTKLYSTSALLEIVIPVLLLSVILFSLLGSKFKDQQYSNRPMLLIFFVAFLGLVFLVSGSNGSNPFSTAYVTVFNSNVLLVPFLRGPYLTFGPALAFVGAILFGYGTSNIAIRARNVIAVPVKTKGGCSLSPSRFRRRAQRSVFIALPVVIIVLCSGVYSYPIWTGQAVSDLQYPATPVVPPSTNAAASFLRDNLGGSSAIVFPATTGYTLENWTQPYLGPPVLPFSGSSVLENVIPPLGSQPSYIVPMAFALPSYNNSPTYGHLLQLLGEKYALIDNGAGFNSLTPRSNVSAIRWTLDHTTNVSIVSNSSGYSIYQVSNSSPRVNDAKNVIPDNLTSSEEVDISGEYALLANNSTDLSAEGLWSSTAEIAPSPVPGFNISAYWPSPEVRSTRGTGFHYPGWAEVTNLAPLHIDVGRYPLVFVWIKTVSDQVNPVIWFSSMATLKEYIGNITTYDQTLNQFFVPTPIQRVNEDGGTLYVYNLATQDGISALPDGVLNHIMIEVQAVGDYYGSLNASVRLGIGSPPFLDPSFDPSATLIVNESVYNEASRAVTNPAPKLTFSETNPSSYEVHVEGAIHQFVFSLLQTFDSHWSLALPAGDSSTHFVADDFANGWIVNVTASNFSLTIEFDLQPFVVTGWVLTVGALVSITILGALQGFGILGRLVSRVAKWSRR